MPGLQEKKEEAMPEVPWWRACCGQCFRSWREQAAVAKDIDICWICGGQNVTTNKEDDHARDSD